MKNLILLLLLFTGIVKAQIVNINIPDANFKAKLLAANTSNGIAKNIFGVNIKIDTNNDGQIQNIEAEEVVTLNVSNSLISNLEGIQSMYYVRKLFCQNNQLTSLDITNLVDIVEVNCSYNVLTSLQLSGFDYLKEFDCSHNNMTTLSIIGGGGGQLNNFNCSYNLLTSINLEANIYNLNCSHNKFTTWTHNSFSTFTYVLDISYNLITSLNADMLILTSLNCSNNLLTNLSISNIYFCSFFNCSNNQLSTINFNEGDPSSEQIITNFYCENNNLINLDLSGNSARIKNLYIAGNNTSKLNIKNGYNTNTLIFGGNTLQRICADENEISQVTQNIVSQGNTNCLVSSYCNFTPGGNFNTIAGNLKFDANNNGCDASDLPQPNIRVNINDGTLTGASFTNTIGDYKFYTQAGSFAITPVVENPTWFNFTPATATIPFADNNNNLTTQDFCIAANGVHHDIEIVIAPIGVARPGFDAEYQITYSNRGNSNFATGEISLVFNEAILDFVQASNIPISQNPGAINWIFSNLLPFETRTITMIFNVNSPVETPAVNINDTLTYTVNCYPSYFEENLTNNQLIYSQTVVGSFDPNDITCLEGNSVAPSEIGNYLHYVINFENTGNFPAENVVVKTIVDPAKFDINSLQLLNTSNPVDARITGNVVEFIFEDIQLAGPGGHGHVLLKIKSKNTLVTGDTVAKRADIFFDYNAPVDTGMATTVFQSLSNTLFDKDDSISVSPNPTTSIININSNFNIKSIELYDVQGRVLETQIGETKTIDISEKTNGIYFLKITTEKGSKIEKLVKE